ncbi:MAG: 30S ribosomal protein S12 methylthiotransferase RimO [Anaerolineaceae bacterium]|nr:30S ribosomal protein S12 methylthiotransferase RimO [Anaerolineaceae bacterium]
MEQQKSTGSFYIESLGCAKNSVDSRSMAELLTRAGYKESESPEYAAIVIVNTCGFILPAREESMRTLREFAAIKPAGQILIAAGCLSEKEKHRLVDEIEGLDAAFGTRRWADILRVVEKARQQPASPYLHFPDTAVIQESDQKVARVAVQGGSAYLKIADGCDRGCAFCAIPLIKGPMVSRSVQSILDDALLLQEKNVKEIILIAQDSTAYGRDLGMRDGLPLLLEELVKTVPNIPWLRVMYTFPGAVSDDLIRVMAEQSQVLPYLDIPLQHAHPDVLRRMHRSADILVVRETITKVRSAIPEVALRTTFIVGFPDETETEFQYLLDFLVGMRFDHVGIFPYYHEEGTSAYDIKDSISSELKEERIQRLAAAQEEISLEINKRFIGKTIEVLIEGNGDGISAGRSYRDAPEIDGLVMFDEVIPVGSLVKGQVSGALVHDLIAKMQ